MSTDFVLDTSVTMTWFFASESSPATDEIQAKLAAGSSAIVPLHWRLEVANVLLMAERKRVTSSSETTQFLSLLDVLSIEIDSQTDRRAYTNTLTIAREHKLTSYDAAYLDLALSRGLALATLDKELRSAAKRLGVKLLPDTL